MNPLFADWHREITVDLATVDLAAREVAADDFAKTASPEGVLILIAAAFGQPLDHGDEAFLRQPFKDAEPAFPMRGNDKELRMLAAAVLEAVCLRADDTSILAGYAVRVATDRGWQCSLPEAVEAAGATLARLGESRRVPADRPAAWNEREAWPDALHESLEEMLGDNAYSSPAQLLSALEAVARRGAAHASDAAAYAETVAAWAENRMALAEENSELLWWLLSGRSETLNATWAALAPATAAAAAGRELADLIHVLPEPPQAAALLEHLLAATSKPRKPADVAVPPLVSPARLAFLIDSAPSGPPLKIGLQSMAQALLARAWRDPV